MTLITCTSCGQTDPIWEGKRPLADVLHEKGWRDGVCPVCRFLERKAA